MNQQTPCPSGKAADDPYNAGVVLESRGLKKTYGRGEKSLHILVDANLSLRRGEMVAVVAPSGAGKSTLLHLLAALDTPTSGTVYFAHKAIETNEDAALAEFRNRAVGFLWQRHQLLPDFTAAENVAMPLLVRGDDFTTALETARKWLAEVGLENRAAHRAVRPHTGAGTWRSANSRGCGFSGRGPRGRSELTCSNVIPRKRDASYS